MQTFPSALRAIGTYTREFTRPKDARGLVFSINFTAKGAGASTLNFKLQYRDGDAWKDITGASIVALSGVGDIDLMIHPDVAAVANRIVKLPVFEALRAVAVVAVDTVTFSVSMDTLP